MDRWAERRYRTVCGSGWIAGPACDSHNGCAMLRWAAPVRFAAVLGLASSLGAMAAAAPSEDLLEQARALRRAGDLNGAAGLLIEAAARLDEPASPAAAPIFRDIGQIRLDQGRGRDAMRRFRQALVADPGLGVVHFEAGLAARSVGEENAAAEHLAAAVRLGFRNGAVLMHLAVAHLRSGQGSAGLRAAREFLDMRPRSHHSLLQVGRALFEQFFYEDAVRAFETALESEPGSLESRIMAALSSNLLGRPEKAVHLLEAVGDASQTPETAALLASALAAAGRIAESDELFRESIRRDPSSPHAHVNLAFSLLDRGLAGEAEEQLRQLAVASAENAPKVFYQVRRNSCVRVAQSLPAAAQGPSGPEGDAYFGLAETLAGRHHHTTALEVLRLAMRHEGGSSRVLLAVARACLHIDANARPAVNILEHLAAREPRSADVLYLLGRAHLQQGRIPDAVSAHREALALAPSRGSFHAGLGRALAESADPDSRPEALSALRTAVRLNPVDVDARYELGKLLLAANRPEEAVRVLEEAVRQEPEFHNAYYVLGQAHLRAGRPERARECLSEFESKRKGADARAGTASGFAPG